MSAAGAPQLPVHHMWGILSYCSHSVSVHLDSSHPPPSSVVPLSVFFPAEMRLVSLCRFPLALNYQGDPHLHHSSEASDYPDEERGVAQISPISFHPTRHVPPACLSLFLKSFSQPLLCHHVVIVSQLHLIHCLFNGGWITRSSSTALGRLDDQLLQAAGTSNGKQKMTVDDCTFWGAGEQGSHSGQLALHGRSLLSIKQDGCGGLPKKVLAFPSP